MKLSMPRMPMALKPKKNLFQPRPNRPHVGTGIADKAIGVHNKGSQIEMLPSRHALSTLTGGDPIQRSLNNYSKLTPSGAGGFNRSYSDIMHMGMKTPKIGE